MFKTRITEKEMYPSISGEIEIAKSNKTKFTRFYLALLSVDEYRKI